MVGSLFYAKTKMAHSLRYIYEGVQQTTFDCLEQPLLNQLEFKMVNHKQQIMVFKL